MIKITDKLIDDIIELILEDMDCRHEVEHDEDGSHTSVEYNLKYELKVRGKILALLEPKVTEAQKFMKNWLETPESREEWIEGKAVVLTTKMPLWVNYKTRKDWAKDFIRSLVEEIRIA